MQQVSSYFTWRPCPRRWWSDLNVQLCAYETVSLGWSPFCDLFTPEEFRGFAVSILLPFTFRNQCNPSDLRIFLVFPVLFRSCVPSSIYWLRPVSWFSLLVLSRILVCLLLRVACSGGDRQRMGARISRLWFLFSLNMKLDSFCIAEFLYASSSAFSIDGDAYDWVR